MWVGVDPQLSHARTWCTTHVAHSQVHSEAGDIVPVVGNSEFAIPRLVLLYRQVRVYICGLRITTQWMHCVGEMSYPRWNST